MNRIHCISTRAKEEEKKKNLNEHISNDHTRPSSTHPNHPCPKCPPSALQEDANALGVLVLVRVHPSESVEVITVGDHTAVETVSVGVGAVIVSYSIPDLTVTGGKVE